MNGITFKENFLENSFSLFEYLKDNALWDERMHARKTCSYGVAYNYSQMSYPYLEFDARILKALSQIKEVLEFEPNNCLVNYYLDGKAKMGFHSDQIDILHENTGVAIVSLGATRTLRFKNIENPNIVKDFELQSGSMIHMTNAIQKEWKHAIPKSDTDSGRMSLTFRKIIK